MVNVGAHVSVAGGLFKGIEKAVSIGARSIQIFGSSPRQWATRLPEEQSIELYKDALKKSDVSAVFLHAPYLVNLGSFDEEQFTKSQKTLCDHLLIAKMINAEGLIFHVGSMASSATREESLDRAALGMKQVLKQVPGKTQLIMENSAGGPSKIGSSLDDLAALFKKTKSNRVKICLDTAHALEGGLIESFTSSNIKKLFDEFDELIGLKNLVVLHANDSKTPYNSHHDLHENIGRGHIGLEGFRNLAKEKRIQNLPWILEVPGFGVKKGPDKKNIQILNSCF
ncbi:MAG: deoxyribonuclease IV [Bacteriovorax sp.]